jgi:hypothetical protein
MALPIAILIASPITAALTITPSGFFSLERMTGLPAKKANCVLCKWIDLARNAFDE